MKIAYIVSSSALSDEEQSAWEWLSRQSDFKGDRLEFERIRKNPDSLTPFDVLWWHCDTSVTLPGISLDPDVKSIILDCVKKGGKFLVSLLAAQYVHELGLEQERPNVVEKKLWDQESWIKDYPDIRGFGGNQGHPIFADLAGAVFTWNPMRGAPYSGAFYAAPSKPREGRIAAVERQYIKLNEDWRLISEYGVGRGAVLAVGSHLFFQNVKDRFRLHLEKFTQNCFSYLANPQTSSIPKTYWNFEPRVVREGSRSSRPVSAGAQDLPDEPSILFMNREPAGVHDSVFDVGGRRILIMGKEQTGIQEIWCHPFRLLRAFRTGFRSGSGAVQWLDQRKPAVTIRPDSVTRIYSEGELRIEETTVGSVDRPGGIVHYQVNCSQPMEMVVAASIDLRFMWPHSEKATGSLTYAWDEGLGAFLVMNGEGNLVSVFGASRHADEHLAGQYGSVGLVQSGLRGTPTDLIQVAAGMRFVITDRMAAFSVVVAGSDRGEAEAIETYRGICEHPGKVLEEQMQYYDRLFAASTMIDSPDPLFNEGYQWALVGTDRFFVETPSLGSSLMAGFGTTERGWDGGQTISGRPGYAWYFGRDACWTAFALLDYGDHARVREVLRFLGRYQDLNGKILHELTTSGHVHYDAADSTPLYLMLMGRYLRASGDSTFVREEFVHLRKAIDFCFSTDTDRDRLIENTNVGHGWVEGGKLFPVHVEFYLAACWAAALEEASHAARAVKEDKLAATWEEEAIAVRRRIRKEFWNETTKFYDFGKYRDGTHNIEKTVLPAVAIYLGCTERENAEHCLTAYAGAEFSSDWGVRIIGMGNPMFRPDGYHYGSVWPLFTGWTALAEYASYRPLQGTMHALSTMRVYQHWAAGYVEEVLQGSKFLPAGVCSHQAWSESMVLQPLLEGMLGLNYNAPEGRLTLKPWFPPHWNQATVRNIRVGGHSVECSMIRSAGKTSFTFKVLEGGEVMIEFQPLLPLRTSVEEIRVGEGRLGQKALVRTYNDSPLITFRLQGKETVEILHRGGIGIVPPFPELREGEESRGLRVVSERLVKNDYVIDFEGLEGSEYSLQLADPDRAIVSVTGAELYRDVATAPILGLSFRGAPGKSYSAKTVRVHLRPS